MTTGIERHRSSDEKHVCAMGRCIRRRYSTCPAVCRARPGYVDPFKKQAAKVTSKTKTCIWMPTLKHPIKWIANCGVDYKHAQQDFKFCPYCGRPVEAIDNALRISNPLDDLKREFPREANALKVTEQS